MGRRRVVVAGRLAGLGVDAVSRWLDGRWRAAWPSAALATVLVAVTLAGAVRFHDGPWRRYPEIAAGYYGWQYGPGQAIAAFAAHRDAYDRFWLDPDFNEAFVFLDFYLVDDAELRGRSAVGTVDRLDLREPALYAVRAERFDALMEGDGHARRFLRVVDVVRYPSGAIALYLVDASLANAITDPRGW